MNVQVNYCGEVGKEMGHHPLILGENYANLKHYACRGWSSEVTLIFFLSQYSDLARNRHLAASGVGAFVLAFKAHDSDACVVHRTRCTRLSAGLSPRCTSSSSSTLVSGSAWSWISYRMWNGETVSTLGGKMRYFCVPGQCVSGRECIVQVRKKQQALLL